MIATSGPWWSVQEPCGTARGDLSAGTRFTARLEVEEAGFIEVDTGIGSSGRLTGSDEWADIGNLHIDPAHRRRGIGTALLAEAGHWLRLARVSRLLAYATPDEVEHRALLERHDVRLLTRTHREWHLPTWRSRRAT